MANTSSRPSTVSRRLAPGRYLLKYYCDTQGKLSRDYTLFLRGDHSAVNSLFERSIYASVTGVEPVRVAPLDDLTAHGCTVDDLAKGVVTDPVRRLLAFECARAREFYQRAVLARPDDDRRRLVAAEIMRAVYFETLRRIERNGYDVFTARMRVRRPMQACIALRQWLWPA